MTSFRAWIKLMLVLPRIVTNIQHPMFRQLTRKTFTFATQTQKIRSTLVVPRSKNMLKAAAFGLVPASLYCYKALFPNR